MKISSKILLGIAKLTPYGHWKLVSLAAKSDPALWDYSIPLTGIPEASLRADLREPVYTQFLRHGCIPHQKAGDTLLRSLIKQGDLVFDIGANIGYLSILFRSLVGSTGKVIAFEPSRRAYFQLERNTAFMNEIIAVNIAISNSNKYLPFMETSCLERSSLEVIQEAVQIVDVKAIRLDDLCIKWGIPNFIKVDVEGHEHAVFEGASDLLKKSNRPLIYFEALNNEALQKIIQILQNLSDNSLVIYRVSNHAKLVPWHHSEGINDYLAVPFEQQHRINSSCFNS